MTISWRPTSRLAMGLVAIAVAMFSSNMQANHSWGGYHWARTTNPFTLKVGDNVSGPWDDVLLTTIADWSQSSVLDLAKVAGGVKTPKNCRPTNGQVEVCNDSYGNNGWLGVAQIWVTSGHIYQGTVKLNDYYMSRAPYNTTAWRNLVSCQEVGHTLGLDHQDEIFDNPNLGTCMDYTNDPSTNQHPNQHDYQELATIYAHVDSSSTFNQALPPPAMNQIDPENPGQWGRQIHASKNGKLALFDLDFGNGNHIFTFIIVP